MLRPLFTFSKYSLEWGSCGGILGLIFRPNHFVFLDKALCGSGFKVIGEGHPALNEWQYLSAEESSRALQCSAVTWQHLFWPDLFRNEMSHGFPGSLLLLIYMKKKKIRSSFLLSPSIVLFSISLLPVASCRKFQAGYDWTLPFKGLARIHWETSGVEGSLQSKGGQI